MNLTEHYVKQLKLLLEILPYVFDEECFCLKGGTAINLFILDFPRVSVDIDLVYLPYTNRTDDLANINLALSSIKNNIIKNFPDIKIHEKHTAQGNMIHKLFVEAKGSQVVIEPNLVLRGALSPVEKRSLTKAAQDQFKLSLSDIPVLSRAEIYAGKICAALDRQHPRDLFDIILLYNHGGLTTDIMKAFVIYLASSSRPMHELLNPNRLDIKNLYDREFLGMTNASISYEDLLEIRERLIDDIMANLDHNDKEFLLSVKEASPKYRLMPYKNLKTFPALQWKIHNIRLMDNQKREFMFGKLSKLLI